MGFLGQLPPFGAGLLLENIAFTTPSTVGPFQDPHRIAFVIVTLKPWSSPGVAGGNWVWVEGCWTPVPWQALIYECLLFDMDMFLSTRIYAPDRSQQGKCRVRAPTKPHGLVCFGWHGRVLAFSTPQGLLLPAPRIVRDSFLAPPLGPKVSPRSTSLRGLAPA